MWIGSASEGRKGDRLTHKAAATGAMGDSCLATAATAATVPTGKIPFLVA